MSRAYHDLLYFDLAGAVPTGEATLIEPNPDSAVMQRVRINVEGPRLAAPTTVFLERSLSKRWRLLGIRTELDGETRDWLVSPE